MVARYRDRRRFRARHCRRLGWPRLVGAVVRPDRALTIHSRPPKGPAAAIGKDARAPWCPHPGHPVALTLAEAGARSRPSSAGMTMRPRYTVKTGLQKAGRGRSSPVFLAAFFTARGRHQTRLPCRRVVPGRRVPGPGELAPDRAQGARLILKAWRAERGFRPPTITGPEGSRNGGSGFTSWKGYQIHASDQA